MSKADTNAAVSALIGPGRVRRRRYRKLLFLAACLAVVIAGAFPIARQIKSIAAQRDEQAGYKEQIEQSTAENEDKLRLIKYMKSDEFAKNYARDELGLMLEDEVRFIEEK